MFGLNPGCYWRRRKPSLSEYDGEEDALETTGAHYKGCKIPERPGYTAKIDRPRRIYPIRVYDKDRKQTKYISGDIIEGKALAPDPKEEPKNV